MRLTQGRLSEYRREVDREAESARAYFRAAVAEFYRRYPDATTEDTRVFVLDLMGSALPNFLDLTSTLACDLFDELADECGFEGEHARLYETTDWQMVDRKVHYLAEFLNDGDKERFRREVADLTRYYCKRAAYDNMVANCRAQRVMWARVPTGLETCAFCFMLASRGFAYTSEEKAKSSDHGYHDHCDCVVVPGFQGKNGNPRVKIDGYDPQGMYDRWKSCELTVNHNGRLGKDWESLPEDEKAGWLERHPGRHGSDKDAKDAYIAARIRNEVESRDWHWLYTGEIAETVARRPSEEIMSSLKGNFGKKVNDHKDDWGIDPSSAADRQRFLEITCRIIDEADEVFPGEFRGQPDGVVFYLLGTDVVMTKPDGTYITTMKDAAINNRRVKDARAENTRGH